MFRYEGEYHQGHRHGKGKQNFANGNSYDGEFFEGKIQGHGTYTCSVCVHVCVYIWTLLARWNIACVHSRVCASVCVSVCVSVSVSVSVPVCLCECVCVCVCVF